MDYFSVTSSASIFFPVLFGIYLLPNQPGLYRALVFFFLFGLITEISATILLYGYHTNNLWVYNIYVLVEGVFWILIFNRWLNNKYAMLIKILAALYAVVWFYFSLIAHSIFEYNNMILIVECIILVPLSAYYLVELSRKTVKPIFQLPEFWFATGVLFYFSSTSMITATAFYQFNGVPMMRITWHLHSLFNIITNFIFVKAFLCSPRKLI